ncbi:MAG TPA: C2 family cysteine protease [Nostocaceae cyanobacterium]|nr:C2 family cysteine protease [Nostocaceae cyanobacterium]
MYSKQHRSNQNSSKSAHTATTNQFAPRKFVVQTKQQEREPISAKEYEKIIASDGNYHDSSIVTYRPTPKIPTIQRKLSIGEIGDKYEQEADQVAQEVVQRIHAPEPPSVPTKEEQEDQQISLKPLENRIQRQESEEETPLRFKEQWWKADMSANTIMNSPISTKEEQEDQQISLKPLENRIQRQESEEETPLRFKEQWWKADMSANTIMNSSVDSVIQRKDNNKRRQQNNRRRLLHPRLQPRTYRIKGATLWAKDKNGNDLPPSLEDVSQGGALNCFLFAAIAAIVKNAPQKIVNMIHDNRNGTYTVAFDGMGNSRNPVRQTVTAEFPINGKHGNVRRNALWPLIIEKAYTQQKGGMDVIEKGGYPGNTIEEMIGGKLVKFKPMESKALMIILSLAKENKRMITVISPSGEKASLEAEVVYRSTSGMHYKHAYVVIDIDQSQDRIKLFNPWGTTHPNADGWVNLKTFCDFFAEVSING